MVPRIGLVIGRLRAPFYTQLTSLLEADWSYTAPAALLRGTRKPLDLVILCGETWPFLGAAIPELRRRRVPTLHVLDGITEWRSVWENPRWVAGERRLPVLQPVLSDKIACLGRSQARLLESWGNIGKCEVTGLPRLDPLIGRRPRLRRSGEACRILVATASRPGFTGEESARARQSLADLKRCLETRAPLAGARVEPVWRLTAGLEEAIGVTSTARAVPLSEQLASVDAVITTPSTVMLEGMLCGLPVALLDYNNRPHYVPAAWTITAAPHLDDVLPELVAPPPAHMLYQETVLHDSLECRTPAGPRLALLISRMIEIGREARSADRPLAMPRRILADPASGHHLPEESLDLRSLYPHHPVFGEMDRLALQAEVAHLRRVVGLRPTQVAYRGLSELQRMLMVRGRLLPRLPRRLRARETGRG